MIKETSPEVPFIDFVKKLWRKVNEGFVSQRYLWKMEFIYAFEILSNARTTIVAETAREAATILATATIPK